MCKLKHIYYLIIFLFGYNSVYAQINISIIKNSGNYWYAEGTGITLDEANNDALRQIINQIQVSVISDFVEKDRTETKITEDREKVNYSYVQEGKISTSSFATLRNVETMVLQPDEPEVVVLRWVAKEEVDKMYQEREQKIKDYVETGKKAEQRLQIDDALRNYYWALMLAKANRTSVYCNFNGKEENCAMFLLSKIKSVLSHIKANLKECSKENNRYRALVQFTYNDKNVASLKLRYFDGQSYVGPLSVLDGVGELDLVSLPSDGKIKIRYEYSFREMTKKLDEELAEICSGSTIIPIDNANKEILVKVNKTKETIKAIKQEEQTLESEEVLSVSTEPITTRKRIEMTPVEYTEEYLLALKQIELSIKQEDPKIAYSYFTPDCYKLYCKLLQETGKISIIGDKQKYDFIRTNNHILCRFLMLKIKFKNGQTFMEKLTFRFNEQTKKIESFAFALTQKAEDDIFNAESSWSDISRYTILQFMEDYQTAYALKRLDYIESIFSDGAIIIVGSVLKPAEKTEINDGVYLNFNNDIKYRQYTKAEYKERLKTIFQREDYVHLTFEDNLTKVINAPRLPKSTAFAIQINQIYNSPSYSDKGYLTLVLDVSKKLPIIHVRLWQPEKTEMLGLDKFINSLNF